MKINGITLLCLRVDVIGKEMSQEEKIQLKDKNWKEKKKRETFIRANANQRVPWNSINCGN